MAGGCECASLQENPEKKKREPQPEIAYAASITSWAYVGLGYVRLRATLHMGHAKMILRCARTRLVLRWGVENQGGRARKAKIMLRLAGTMPGEGLSRYLIVYTYLTRVLDFVAFRECLTTFPFRLFLAARLFPVVADMLHLSSEFRRWVNCHEHSNSVLFLDTIDQFPYPYRRSTYIVF